MKGRVADLVVISIILIRTLAVEIAPIITNDGVGYLRRSLSPISEGWIYIGFKQPAYTVWTSITSSLGGFVGLDPAFSVVLPQRLLHIALVISVWITLRWFSIPVLMILTSSTYVVLMNYLLPEALLVPLSGLAALALVSIALDGKVPNRYPRSLVILIGLAMSMAMLIKLQYAVLGAFLLYAAYTLSKVDRRISTRFALGAITSVTVVLIAQIAGQSLENKDEYAAAAPIANRSHADWWGAWNSTFAVHPENTRLDGLEEFYDDGSVHEFITEMDSLSDPSERVRRTDERIEQMFDAADTSSAEQQLESFVGALSGGRIDDLSRSIDRALAGSSMRTPESWVGQNGAANRLGLEEFYDDVNGGQQPLMVAIPGLASSQVLLGDYRPLKEELAFFSLALLTYALLLRNRTSLAALAAGIVVALPALALSSGYIDNARYLLSGLTVAAIMGTAVVLDINRTPAPNQGRQLTNNSSVARTLSANNSA